MRFLPLLLFSLSAFAQTLDGISTSASRNVSLSPDGAVFTVDVTSEFTLTVEQVLDALKDTGLAARDLVAISSALDYGYNAGQPVPPSRVVREFQTSVPYAKVKELSDKLDTVRKTLAANNTDLRYTFFVTASDAAAEEARRQVIPELITEMRKKAEFLASAANLNLGPLLSVNENVYSLYSYTSSSLAGIVSTSGSPMGSINGLRVTFTVYGRFSAQSSGQ